MDIRILDSWLRDYLTTKAKPEEIAKYLSLCGPSVERIKKSDKDFVYEIEITTNRIDEVGVYGIAREAAAILPRFGIPAKLKPIKIDSSKYTFAKKVSYLDVYTDATLCPRFTAVLIKNVNIGKSPKYIQERLSASDVRPINNVVDITNYVMLELGQPMHSFDYDKIKNAKMALRESKKGESVTTLDGKRFTLPGGDIVIEDGSKKLIDLAGIMGGQLSAVDSNTKNILLFVQTYNPSRIRRTSMHLSQRTMAATIFEKGTDPNLVGTSLLSAIKLYESITKGSAEKVILDIYPKPYKSPVVKVSRDFIQSRLGVDIPKKDAAKYLLDLGFECSWSGNTLCVSIPSHRAKDVYQKEDVLEEIARIYGYHNLPSKIMSGDIPDRPQDPRFKFEEKIKNIVSGFGGTETYTLSLVPKDKTDGKALKIKNPLGTDTEYMRTSLMPSLLSAASENIGTINKFHLYEIANVYLPRVNDLPEEKTMLAGVFCGYEYRSAKGIVEAILNTLHIMSDYKISDSKGYGASKCAEIMCSGTYIGKIGIPENSKLVYYEFEMDKLITKHPKVVAFKPISKYPIQTEDITFNVHPGTSVWELIKSITSVKYVKSCTLTEIYNQIYYTFTVSYHNSDKTLTDNDVQKIRKEIIAIAKSKFGTEVKD